MSDNTNIKGKILTNKSLVTCLYHGDNNICKEKDMPCLGNDVVESCSDKEKRISGECKDLSLFLLEKNIFYDETVEKCSLNSEGKIVSL